MTSKRLQLATLTAIVIFNSNYQYAKGIDKPNSSDVNSTILDLSNSSEDCSSIYLSDAAPSTVPQQSQNLNLGRQMRESLYINDSCKFDFFMGKNGMYIEYKGIYSFYRNNQKRQTIFSFSVDEKSNSFNLDIKISDTDFSENVTNIKIKNNLVFLYHYSTLIKCIEGQLKEEISNSTYQNLKKIQGEWMGYGSYGERIYIFDYPYYLEYDHTGTLDVVGFYKVEGSKIHVTQSGGFKVEMNIDPKEDIIRLELGGKISKTKIPQSDMRHRAKRIKIDGHLCVDLGLSVLWATQNLNTRVPDDLGGEYFWSGLEPNVSFTRHNIYNENNTHIGTDGEERLNSSRDAARVQWGGKWRMPTKKEALELVRNCTFKHHSNGIFVVSSINGNYIFLPLSHEANMYWLSELHNTEAAYKLSFKGTKILPEYLWRGGLIRPVIKKVQKTK